ncbi:MAG: hypothetical protein EBW05_05655, partial [Betaproteobacteria bacterium]|nr:hypothetical protein [Betaproteobacteria bacterium]
FTDNIRVRSIIGRFLEHSRVFYFRSGDKEDLYLSSADWMNRNMMRRIEIAWPIWDPILRQRIIDECLVAYLYDTSDAWLLESDGHYHRQPLADQETLVRVHEPLNILDLLDGSAASHSWPLDKALEKIAGFDGAGVVVLLNVAQNADAVFQRFEACLAADRGDTAALQAMRRAAKTDLRTYGIGAQILRDLGVRKMRLLSNPRKIPSMSGFNLEVLGFVTHA